MRVQFVCMVFVSAALVACSGGSTGSIPAPALHGGAGAMSSLQQPSGEVAASSTVSHITYYQLGSNPSSDLNGYQLLLGSDGDVYYTTVGPYECGQFACASTAGTVGQLDPVTKAFTEIPVAGAPYNLAMTPDGAIWSTVSLYSVGTTGELLRISPFSSSNVTQIPLPVEAGASPEPMGIAYNASDQDVYFTDQLGSRVGKIPAAGPYATASMTMYSVPNGSVNSAAPWGAAVAPNGNVFFADRNNGIVYKLSTGGALKGYVTPQQLGIGNAGSSEPFYVAVGSDKNVYVSLLVPGFDKMTQSGTYTALALPPNAGPYKMSAAGGVVAFGDLGNYAIAFYTISTGALREIPTAAQVGDALESPNGIAIKSASEAFFVCNGPPPTGGSLCIGDLRLGATWAVFPGKKLTLKTGKSPTQQLIGIGESGNSGPFTVLSSNTATVTVTSIPGMDHNFVLAPGTTAGTATVTVTDAHGVSVPIAVTVK